MDEPTIPEMLRDLQADVSRILANLDRYVTQEQRASDKEVSYLKLAAVVRDHTAALETIAKAQAEDRAKMATVSRWLWSGVVAPVIVGIILYVLLGKSP